MFSDIIFDKHTDGLRQKEPVLTGHLDLYFPDDTANEPVMIYWNITIFEINKKKHRIVKTVNKFNVVISKVK